MSTMKQVSLMILAGILFLAIITGLGFYFGYVGNIFDATVGKQRMDVQRENFKHSKSYVEGMIQDLASYKREYDRAKTDEEKQQILIFVDDEFANFDINQIESIGLQNFLLKARGE